jgi:hypothetical protein
MESQVLTAIKRQVPFLIGGTITGVIMAYCIGFPIKNVVNSVIWYLFSYVIYRLIWKMDGLQDQKILLRYFMDKIKTNGGKRLSVKLICIFL